jgi:hypothetical protein
MDNLSIHKRWISLLILMVVAICMCSCSTLPFRSSEDSLRIRVEEMMNARINDDWEKVYGYLDPGYRNRISKTNFVNIRREMDFTKYSIISVEVQPSGKEAFVKIKQDMSVKVFEFKDQPEKQHWVKDGFSWYMKVTD